MANKRTGFLEFTFVFKIALKKIIYSMLAEVKAYIMKYALSLLTYMTVLKHLVDLNRCEFEPILSHADTKADSS